MKKIFLLLVGLLFLGSVHGSDDDQGPSREDVLRNFLTGKRGSDTIVVEPNDVALAAPLMRDLNGVGAAKKTGLAGMIVADRSLQLITQFETAGYKTDSKIYQSFKGSLSFKINDNVNVLMDIIKAKGTEVSADEDIYKYERFITYVNRVQGSVRQRVSRKNSFKQKSDEFIKKVKTSLKANKLKRLQGRYDDIKERHEQGGDALAGISPRFDRKDPITGLQDDISAFEKELEGLDLNDDDGMIKSLKDQVAVLNAEHGGEWEKECILRGKDTGNTKHLLHVTKLHSLLRFAQKESSPDGSKFLRPQLDLALKDIGSDGLAPSLFAPLVQDIRDAFDQADRSAAVIAAREEREKAEAEAKRKDAERKALLERARGLGRGGASVPVPRAVTPSPVAPLPVASPDRVSIVPSVSPTQHDHSIQNALPSQRPVVADNSARKKIFSAGWKLGGGAAIAAAITYLIYKKKAAGIYAELADLLEPVMNGEELTIEIAEELFEEAKEEKLLSRRKLKRVREHIDELRSAQSSRRTALFSALGFGGLAVVSAAAAA